MEGFNCGRTTKLTGSNEAQWNCGPVQRLVVRFVTEGSQVFP